MIEVKLTFQTIAEVAAYFAQAPAPAVPVDLLAGAMALNDIPAEVQEAAAPAKKPRARKNAEAPAEAVADAAPAAVEPAQESTAEQFEQTSAPSYTVDDVRKALQAYSGRKGFPAATDLVKSFGATRITELKAEDYAAFIAKTEEKEAA
jgi:hypothetical protein